MHKQSFLIYCGLSLFAASLLSGCSSKSSFTITWENYDGTVLERDLNVKKGATPTFNSKTPYRLEDNTNYYVFSSWSPEIAPVKKDTKYTAQYEVFPITNVDETPDGYVDVLPTDSAKSNIFHAFCWKFNDIKDHLADIKNAGFKNIQISPVQEPKGGGAEWWAFYQPLSFSIAKHSKLGTKAELTALCSEAESLGISIIADIVFNHMANINDDEKESDGTPKVFPGVEEYEPEIFGKRNDANNPTFHHNPNAKGSGADTQYYAHGGLPDLNTANELVQQRSLALLKECIDVGIDGFRFDAAKHIETPDDPDYPSNFWPNTLGVAKEYYKTKTGKDLLAYGEILGGPIGRDISVYTKLMRVTDDSYANSISSALTGDAKKALGEYTKKTDADNLITWIESHDTYTSEKSHFNSDRILRGYAVTASRKSSRSLYLSRPDDNQTVGIISDFSYESNVLGAINRFHDRFVDGEEYQSAVASTYVNQRVNGDAKGAIIVDFNPSGKAALSLDKLGTGVYYDQITGKSYTIRNGHLIVDLPDSGIIVLSQSKNAARPTIEVSSRGGLFVGSIDVNIKVNGSAYYTINGGSHVVIDKETNITLGDVVDANNKVTLVVHAENGGFSLERVYTFTKFQLIEGYYNVVNIDPTYFTSYEIFMWSWGPNDNGHWSKDYQVQDGVLLINVDEYKAAPASEKDKYGYKLACFKLGTKKEGADRNTWGDDSLVIKKTSDFSFNILAQGYYDASDF